MNLSETLWLQGINFILALVVLVCCGALGVLLAHRIDQSSLKFSRRRTGADLHTLTVDDLGVTMADGGEKRD